MVTLKGKINNILDITLMSAQNKMKDQNQINK